MILMMIILEYGTSEQDVTMHYVSMHYVLCTKHYLLYTVHYALFTMPGSEFLTWKQE